MLNVQEEIIQKGGLILSESTLDTECLLTTFYDFLEKHSLNEKLRKEIRDCFTEKPTAYNHYFGLTALKEDKRWDAEHLLNEDIFDFFNEIAPEGYIFSSSTGDGSCFGFWSFSEE